ncbi:MAG: fatty acid desaturase [Actinomycetota bacterium]
MSRTDVRPPAAMDRGAPHGAAWRNPTLWLFLGFVAAMAVQFSYLAGAVAWPLAIAAGVIGRYLGFTVMHEASHRVAHRAGWLNDGLGWVTALPLTLTFPMFRSVHTKHHANTNHPEIDPDLDVGRRPLILRPLWLLAPAFTYRQKFYANGWHKRAWHRTAQIALDVAIVAAIGGSLAAEWGSELVVVAVAPTVITVMILTYCFDLLPHRPYDSTERYHDTRAMPSRVRNVVFLGQNYHLVHHLWNSVPWFRYQRVFAERRDELMAVGARID